MAQNNPQRSGIEQEQTARERCRLCILSNFCPCGLRAHTAERRKRQKKGPAGQKAVTEMLLFPCSAPLRYYKPFASRGLLPAFLLHAHVSVCLHTASCDHSFIWRPEYQQVSSTLCSHPFPNPQHSAERMLKPQSCRLLPWCSSRTDHPPCVYGPWLSPLLSAERTVSTPCIGGSPFLLYHRKI